MYGTAGAVTVNSVHHQAVKDPAPGFVVEAVSVTDGVVEALRRPDGAFLAGVQWHPEFTPADDTEQLAPDPLVIDFLAACRAGVEGAGGRRSRGCREGRQPGDGGSHHQRPRRHSRPPSPRR